MDRPSTSAKERDNEIVSKEQLDDALLEEKSVIVIKDHELCKRTVLWMCLGNCVRQMTLVTAAGTAICCSGIHESLYQFRKPLALASVLTNIGYYAIWKPFPLSNYRLAQGAEILCPTKENEHPPNTILVRKVEEYTGVICTVASVAATAAAFWNELASLDFKQMFSKIGTLGDKADAKENVVEEK